MMKFYFPDGIYRHDVRKNQTKNILNASNNEKANSSLL